jgi:hypothetical protein
VISTYSHSDAYVSAKRANRPRKKRTYAGVLGQGFANCLEICGDDAAGFLIAILTARVLMSPTCLLLWGSQIATSLLVTFCYRCSETMTCPFCGVLLETWSLGTASVLHDEVAAIWSGLTRAIFEFDAAADSVSDLKRVSVGGDEVVVNRSGCQMQSVDAHEICRDGLLGLVLYHLQGRICLVRGVVVGISFSCHRSVSQCAQM